MIVIIIANFLASMTINTFAHETMLDVEYDACVDSLIGDSAYEMWYVLDDDSNCYHISHLENTIKYYFDDQSWSSITDAEDIQNAYANSMKKWNNVYFYSYDATGNIIKNKIINIEEGTSEDHNLLILPGTSDNRNVAETQAMWGFTQETGTINHLHYYEWQMGINIDYFAYNGTYSEDVVNSVRERTGAHEIGHVLGLRDVDSDNLCGANATEDHHLEILMGYGEPFINRSQDITYKDIAGVAITRGFHTDDDHQWIKHGRQDDGTYKLVCSICNGVKYVESLSGYSYVTYGSCAGNHALGIGYMIPVASYGTKDYYKCKYCSYVAPFNSIVEQNYVKTNYTNTHHECVNNVAGLEYTFYEEHYNHHYARNDTLTHYVYCECGRYMRTSYHVVPAGNAFFKICVHCGERLNMGEVLLPVPGPYSQSTSQITFITDAGSYVDSDGIIYLVESDMALYLAGELDVYALARSAGGLVTQ